MFLTNSLSLVSRFTCECIFQNHSLCSNSSDKITYLMCQGCTRPPTHCSAQSSVHLQRAGREEEQSPGENIFPESFSPSGFQRLSFSCQDPDMTQNAAIQLWVEIHPRMHRASTQLHPSFPQDRKQTRVTHKLKTYPHHISPVSLRALTHSLDPVDV